MLVSALVVQASIAAFSDTTATNGDWSSGSVALTNNHADATFTTAGGMVPGDTDEACVTVTYNGDIDAQPVRLYGSTTESTPSDLGEYLDLSIEEVDIGTGTCAAPDTVEATIFTNDNTLSVNTGSFTASHTDWTSGLASNWAPTTTDDTQDYRITVTVKDNNDAQGLSATATFNWEAQSQSS